MLGLSVFTPTKVMAKDELVEAPRESYTVNVPIVLGIPGEGVTKIE